MAETLKADTKADKVASPGNKVISKGAIADFEKRYNTLGDEFATASGEFRSDVKELLDEAAAALGMTRMVLRHKFSTRRAEAKRRKKEANFEASEKDQLKTLGEALGDFIDTPLGNAALGDGE